MSINEIVSDLPTEQVVESIPTPSDPEWTDYVVSLLSDNELYKGLPTANGLRRVCERLYGEIIESQTEVLSNQSNLARYAAVKHTIVVRDDTGVIKRVSACVDGYSNDLPVPFNKHLIATLDSKAEAKALRRLLKLTIVSFEEVDQSTENSLGIDYNSTSEDVNNINDNQKIAINTMCKRLNVNAIALLQSIDEKNYKLHDVAAKAVGVLSDYQKNIDSIPEEIKGFDLTWRDKLGV